MAQPMEHRQRRNGSHHAGAGHVREDISALQRDIGKLSTDLSALAASQWSALNERVNGGVESVSEGVRTRPIAALGLAAGIGLVAGYALAAMAAQKSVDEDAIH